MFRHKSNSYNKMRNWKYFLTVLLLLCVGVFSSHCFGKEKSVILFNKNPITQDSILSPSNTNVFKPNERIYYLITLPKKSTSKMLLVQVLKIGGEGERLGYELVWGKRVKLRDEQVHYFTDYIVFNTAGAYAMRVYSRDNPTKVLTTAYFYVRN